MKKKLTTRFVIIWHEEQITSRLPSNQVLKPNIADHNPSELRSIVATAHENELLVRALVIDSTLLDRVLDADVDVIDHVPIPSFSPEYWEGRFDDAHVFKLLIGFEQQILRMIEQGVALVPTLEAYAGLPVSRDRDPEEDFFFRLSLVSSGFSMNQVVLYILKDGEVVLSP